MTNETTRRAGRDLAFERKAQLSAWALAFELLWPRLWLLIGVVGAFILVSLAGFWPLLGDIAHRVLLGAFAIALLAALVHAVRIPWPSRDEAIRRIERMSGVAHRPASSYEDTLSGGRGNATTMAIWDAHRKRLSDLLARLRVGPPQPRTHRHDPLALRALMMLGVVTLLALAGDSASDRLRSAFRFGGPAGLADARLDAWIAPPAYTQKPPVMLADGSKPGPMALKGTAGVIEVPARSVLIVRSSGAQAFRLGLELTRDGAKAPEVVSDVRTEARDGAAAATPGSGISEIRYEITASGRLRVLGSGTELAAWTLAVIPDAPPQITLTKDLERTARGSMKVYFKASDDYGVASAVAKFDKVKPSPGNPSKAWARPNVLKGPRPPLERPPVLALRLLKSNAKEIEGDSYLELAQHPWAGLRVAMRLEAKDVAGQTGLSSPIEIVMPERRFEKPLARAIIEQRRKLQDDPRYRGEVLKALAALSLGPDEFNVDPKIYLLMKSAQHRLTRDMTRAGRKSVLDQLWHLALKIEDGDLSDAEKRLKDAQDKLSKALENGASEEEIKQLMQEMRQAMNDYMRELQKQAEANQSDQQQPDGSDQQNQQLSQQDIDRMMKNIEEMAKNGAREQAQQMLSELRDLMERLQSGRQAQEQQRQNREAMQKMDELGNMVGEQQKLMDDTFGEQRDQDQQKPGQRGQGQPKSGQQKQGQKGQPAPGQKGQKGQGQQGQKGQGQQQGQGQQGEGQQGQPGEQGRLGQRQGALKDKLGKLQRDLRDLGMGDSEKLDSAREAMENAERALNEGDLAEATEQQSQALDDMRQGAQSMAQEMMKNMPQRFGQNGDTPRDPLGRPQRSEGPDQGNSVKIPGEIDMQRAREILEELRRRSSESTRPPVELDYLERLLKRF